MKKEEDILYLVNYIDVFEDVKFLKYVNRYDYNSLNLYGYAGLLIVRIPVTLNIKVGTYTIKEFKKLLKRSIKDNETKN